MNKRLTIVLKIHLFVWIAYSILFWLIALSSGESLGWAIGEMFALSIHIGVGLVIGIIMLIVKKHDLAKGNFLGVVIVALIGFPTCFVASLLIPYN